MDFLHTLKYIHRDIKPANILRHRAENEEKYTYKIADFGLAVKYNNISDLSTICGTKRFMAPEMNGNRYGPEVDVWSLGVLYYSMLVGKHAQVDATKEETYKPMQVKTRGALYPNDLNISLPTQNLIDLMLKKEPTLRITLQELKVRLHHNEINFTKYQQNGTFSDSGVASSCTSGSLSGNNNSTGAFRYLNTYSQDKNVVPGLLQSVAEEQTSIESGIETCKYRTSVTPRTNFIRTPYNDKSPHNITPLKAPYINIPYKSPMPEMFQKFSPIVPDRQQFHPMTNNGNFAPNMHSTVTVDSSYHKGQVQAKPPPLNTLRLRPSTKDHKTKKGCYCILKDGSVKMELQIEKRARQNGEPSIISITETLIISSDGQTIEVKRSDGKPSGMKYQYDTLPEKYWTKYSKASEVVKSFKATTPKIVWTTNDATCKLMENGKLSNLNLDANFVVEFNCGVKFEYDAIKSIVTVSDKHDSVFDNENHNFKVRQKVDFQDFDLLKQHYSIQCERFRKYHKRTKEIEIFHEEMQSKDLSPFDALKESSHFPIRMGNNKLQTSSSSMVITSTYSTVNTHNNASENLLENRNFAYSAGELNIPSSTQDNRRNYGERVGTQSPLLRHTHSTPDMQAYPTFSRH